MKNLTRNALLLSLLAVIASTSNAFAYQPNQDMLVNKGYSPELVDTAQAQVNRQEWREPMPQEMAPMERFFHNVYNNDWTGSVDEFGAGIIRDPQ